jgi:CHAT domain-containing protein
MRTPPQRDAGARVLAHSYDGRLPETQHEAALVGAQLSGEIHLEDAAGRDCLAAAPVQILHIAAHGKHRMDYPELSYLRLADGQLFSDDVLQYDLSYELVTLSACETGQAVVTAGEDLIGLGRGVLVAGAGALIASLWSVHDRIVPELMRLFYDSLLTGASKSAALRQAQLATIAGVQELHPAFWGAFQLIGDPRPLSVSQENN